MSKVYADAVATPEPTDDLTLGGSGDNVIVTAGATLKTNTVKDSGGNTLWTSDGSGNLSSQNSGLKGNMVLLTTNTSSNVASSSFTSLIDSTYKLYIFKFYDVNPASDGPSLGFQGNVAGQSGFNETMTTATFRTRHGEDGSHAEVHYIDSSDQAQGTAYQSITQNTGNAADESNAGTLFLFNPSNTTYVKHFYVQGQSVESFSKSYTQFTAGYFNVTGAIDEIDFKFSTGNIANGTIKMYGVG